MPELFDMNLRALRRDRAARIGPELFLNERAFEDCMERIGLLERKFERLLLIGCPDATWPERLRALASTVEVRDPGPLFAKRSGGEPLIEDRWVPPQSTYDCVLAVGTLDTVNDLPRALQLIRSAMVPDALFIGAVSGGDTIPQLRNAVRAADAVSGAAAPHAHPRIEASALAPLLEQAGFANPVVDVDRVPVSYRSFESLISDLRAMAATNLLQERPRFIGKAALAAARDAFTQRGDGTRTLEIFEILHFAAWSAKRQ